MPFPLTQLLPAFLSEWRSLYPAVAEGSNPGRLRGNPYGRRPAEMLLSSASLGVILLC